MPTYGFAGTINDLNFARLHALGSARAVVENSTSWVPSVTATARQVSFTAGNVLLPGLRFETTGASVVANAVNSSGSTRLDLIVLRADWVAKTVTLTAITGSSSTVAPTPSRTLMATGTVYDIPLVVCRTISGGGAYSGSDLFDVRLWGGVGGAYSAAQATHLYVNDLTIGQEVLDNSTGKRYRVEPSGTLTEVGVGGKIYDQVSTADYTLTTSQADVTGATVTFSTGRTNVTCWVTGSFDLRTTGTGTGYCYGLVLVDGVASSRRAIWLHPAAETRTPGVVSFPVTLASAGSHTIKLRAYKDVGAGTAIVGVGTSTSISVDVRD